MQNTKIICSECLSHSGFSQYLLTGDPSFSPFQQRKFTKHTQGQVSSSLNGVFLESGSGEYFSLLREMATGPIAEIQDDNVLLYYRYENPIGHIERYGAFDGDTPDVRFVGYGSEESGHMFPIPSGSWIPSGMCDACGREIFGF